MQTEACSFLEFAHDTVLKYCAQVSLAKSIFLLVRRARSTVLLPNYSEMPPIWLFCLTRDITEDTSVLPAINRATLSGLVRWLAIIFAFILLVLDRSLSMKPQYSAWRIIGRCALSENFVYLQLTFSPRPFWYQIWIEWRLNLSLDRETIEKLELYLRLRPKC